MITVQLKVSSPYAFPPPPYRITGSSLSFFFYLFIFSSSSFRRSYLLLIVCQLAPLFRHPCAGKRGSTQIHPSSRSLLRSSPPPPSALRAGKHRRTDKNSTFSLHISGKQSPRILHPSLQPFLLLPDPSSGRRWSWPAVPDILHSSHTLLVGAFRSISGSSQTVSGSKHLLYWLTPTSTPFSIL